MISVRLYQTVCYTLVLLVPVCSSSTRINASEDFWDYRLTFPRIYHAIHKREISTSKESEGKLKHLDHVTITVDLHGKNRILDLQLNRALIGEKYFEEHQVDEGYFVKKPRHQDIELCHYNGLIRGIQNSWVAISTCDGLRGMLYDGSDFFYIERALITNSTNPVTGLHVVYKHSDLKSNFTCGVSDSLNRSTQQNHHHSNTEHGRTRRSTNTIHGPYNSNRLSRYIELVLVIDTKEYKAFNEDISRVHQHSKDIANIINSLYVPLNIFVALVGVVIWTKYDEITMETNGDKTLTSFLTYRRERLVKEHPNDNAQLLTRLQFENGVVGKALKGPICTFEFSGGVNMDHSNVVGLVATTIAHEMGHNLGMEHDTEHDCKCPGERCIMSPSSSSFSPTEWSSCSREYLTVAFEHGMDYCLRNKPISLFDGPVCGNGFVESGEQCDCGLKEKCDNPCCEASTCMLHANASCATGECCDFQTCKPRSAGTECRSVEHECDLPEYCTGLSEYCPDDVFKIDGESCDHGRAYCYQGNCRTHADQCRILWGPSGLNSDMACYNMNIKGNRHGNCGYSRLNQSFIKCQVQDVYCGMLQCKHYNERLEFGMESVAIISHSFINGENGSSIIPCRTAIVDLGLNEVDPGLAPDGAKCAENHMCFNQKCMPVSSLRTHTVPSACPENCNGNGVCNSRGHCHCSKGFAPPFCDSSGVGGSIDSGPADDPHNFNILRNIFFYMMLTVLPIVLALIAYSYYVRKSPSYFWKRNQRRTIQKSVEIHLNLGEHRGNRLNSTVQKLLSNSTRGANIPNEEAPNASLRDNLIGNFKGFSISPLPNNGVETNKLQMHNTYPTGTGASSPIHNIPVSTVARVLNNSAEIVLAHVSTANAQSKLNTLVCRPCISAPVLDKTTSSAVKQLMNKNVPIRPAPPVPVITKIERSNLKVDKSDSGKSPAKERCSEINRKEFFVCKPQPMKNDCKKDELPWKATKIDKDTLKSLVISDPIPLSEPGIPVNALPLSEDQEKSVLTRAQSLKQSSYKRCAGTTSFGSVRLSRLQRPTSISACSRPTSPPPRPPSPSSATNAVIKCGSTSTRKDYEDNIYAVIEENPTKEKSKRPSPFKKTSLLCSDDGLLKEIVHEIQARNVESIYSNDTDRKETILDVPTSDSCSCENNLSSSSNDHQRQQLHKSISNSITSISSEYLKPITANVLEEVENKTYPVPMKVPEERAPGYKPFNTNKKTIAVYAERGTKPLAKTKSEKLDPLLLNRIKAKSSQEESSSIRKTDTGSESLSLSLCVHKLNNADSSTDDVVSPSTKAVTKPNLFSKTEDLKQSFAMGAERTRSGIPIASKIVSMHRKFETRKKEPLPFASNNDDEELKKSNTVLTDKN